MSALSDLLNSQPISARQAAIKAAKEGVYLPYGTISGFWSGRHGRPTRETLARLAQVLSLTEAQLQHAAWSATAPLGPWVPPESSAFLTKMQRRALDLLVNSIAHEQGAGRVVSGDSPASSGTSVQEGSEGQEDGTSPDDTEPTSGLRNHRRRLERNVDDADDSTG